MKHDLTKHYTEVLNRTSHPNHKKDALMMLYLINNNLDYKTYWSKCQLLDVNNKIWYNSTRHASDSKCRNIDDLIRIK